MVTSPDVSQLTAAETEMLEGIYKNIFRISLTVDVPRPLSFTVSLRHLSQFHFCGRSYSNAP